ncbi:MULTISPECIES: hypothetical protein [unclassified Mycolicibacterium]|uniref:hypothetical protein n=1 Tax=unclassified Mycolicibacterium TaxID=2636767 RepID=UPI0012DFA45E|nr:MULTISPECIES: hypothetical protein [unclassified Mycolicibacterium]MUL85735.1 hypothetical protein [Mycolicibacterium sp. CBMA 329]MUL91612.1 hypothetical protein [Mycolicibacterium sp. CBMA 331]MUM02149.1 hypothetical protein [Mycolicibacterium sp. CBMA 334]MUM28831.1 hypothetical protein [Mycolicibacterium sp. CBMA 295]MUM41098.1 hypothetical protein [Mycolicibacterium sp. CBMA 247]
MSMAFVSPDQINCTIDFKGIDSIICGGNVRGIPASVKGTGCPDVRRDGAEPYRITRGEDDCVPARYAPMEVGQKLIGERGTCAVGEGGLVACIEADHKHGFVLQPSGSWTF